MVLATFVTAIVPFYALGVASVFMLRRKANFQPSFRVPLYPFVPALFVVGTVYLLVNALIDPSSRWATAAVLADIVRETQHELLLMTYSAKPYPPLTEALRSAAERGAPFKHPVRS